MDVSRMQRLVRRFIIQPAAAAHSHTMPVQQSLTHGVLDQQASLLLVGRIQCAECNSSTLSRNTKQSYRTLTASWTSMPNSCSKMGLRVSTAAVVHSTCDPTCAKPKSCRQLTIPPMQTHTALSWRQTRQMFDDSRLWTRTALPSSQTWHVNWWFPLTGPCCTAFSPDPKSHRSLWPIWLCQRVGMTEHRQA